MGDEADVDASTFPDAAGSDASVADATSQPDAPPGQHLVAVTLAGTGSGVVTSSPDGINCGSDCAEFYDDGAIVTLTAIEEPPASFVGWSGGNCSGLMPCTLTVNSATNVTARFQLDDVAAGNRTSCAIVPGSGALRCWGYNNSGQLGLGHTDSIGDTEFPSTESEISVGGDVVKVTLGHEHTCALLGSGEVKCWGLNDQGQRGDGTLDTVGTNPGDMPPASSPVPGTVTDIAAGANHTCVVTATGEVYCWGDGSSGQLGYGATTDLGGSPGTVAPQNGPVPVGGSAVAVAAGALHTCALLTNGNVRCWGLGSLGSLGYGNQEYVGTEPTNTPDLVGDVNVGGPVVQIAAAEATTCVRLSNGDVKCWGLGSSGRNGQGNTETIGETETPSSVPPIDLGEPAVHIEVGMAHVCAVLVSGDVRCWGEGRDGRLGYGNEVDIGDTETPGSLANPVDVGGPVVQITAGTDHTCARLTAGTIRCWGGDAFGALGYGSPSEAIGDTEDPADAGDVPYLP